LLKYLKAIWSAIDVITEFHFENLLHSSGIEKHLRTSAAGIAVRLFHRGSRRSSGSHDVAGRGALNGRGDAPVGVLISPFFCFSFE
jgi:hypothetical protein